MRTRSRLYIGGGFVSAGLVALATYQTIDALVGSANEPAKQLHWYWPVLGVVSFLVFAGMVYWGWYSEYKRAKQLEDQQPTIELTPKWKGKFARLEVKNIGQHEASFKVKVTQWEGITSNQLTQILPYDARWKGSSTSSNKLSSGEPAEIEIMQNEGQVLDDQGKEKPELQGIQINCPGNLQSKIAVGSRLKFSIQIFSEPKLKSKVERTYALVVGNGDWQQFEEVSK